MCLNDNEYYASKVFLSFNRDIRRGKLRNCVLILFQNRRYLTSSLFCKLFGYLVEFTNVIDLVPHWDKNSQYKYYQLLDEYLFICA